MTASEGAATPRDDARHIEGCAAVLANAMGRHTTQFGAMTTGVLVINAPAGEAKVFVCAKPDDEEAALTAIDLDENEQAVLSMVLTRWDAVSPAKQRDWLDLCVSVQVPRESDGGLAHRVAIAHLLTTCNDLLKPGVPARLQEQHSLEPLAQANAALALMLVGAAKVSAEHG